MILIITIQTEGRGFVLSFIRDLDVRRRPNIAVSFRPQLTFSVGEDNGTST
jgi:hypothetical protein